MTSTLVYVDRFNELDRADVPLDKMTDVNRPCYVHNHLIESKMCAHTTGSTLEFDDQGVRRNVVAPDVMECDIRLTNTTHHAHRCHPTLGLLEP